MNTAGFDVVYQLDRGLLENALRLQEADLGSGPEQLWPPFLVKVTDKGFTIQMRVVGVWLTAERETGVDVLMDFVEGMVSEGGTVRARDLDGSVIAKAFVAASEPKGDPEHPDAPPRSVIGISFGAAPAELRLNPGCRQRLEAERGAGGVDFLQRLAGAAIAARLQQLGVQGGSLAFSIDASKESNDLRTFTRPPTVRWIDPQTLGIFGMLAVAPNEGKAPDKHDRDLQPAPENPYLVGVGDPIGMLVSPRGIRLAVGVPMVRGAARRRVADDQGKGKPEGWIDSEEGQRALAEVTLAPAGSGHWYGKAEVPSPFSADLDIHTLDIEPSDGRLLVHARSHVDLAAAGSADVDVPVAVSLTPNGATLEAKTEVLDPDVNFDLALWATILVGVIGTAVSGSALTGVLIAWIANLISDAIIGGVAESSIKEQAGKKLNDLPAQQLPFTVKDVAIKPEGMLVRGAVQRETPPIDFPEPRLHLIVSEVSATASPGLPAKTETYNWPGDPEIGVEPRLFTYQHTWTDHVYEIKAQPLDIMQPFQLGGWAAQLGRTTDQQLSNCIIWVDPRPSAQDGPDVQLGEREPQVFNYWARTPIPDPEGTTVSREIELKVEPGAGAPGLAWRINTRGKDANYFIYLRVWGSDAAGHQLHAETWLAVKGERAVFGDDYRAAEKELAERERKDIGRIIKRHEEGLLEIEGLRIPRGPEPWEERVRAVVDHVMVAGGYR